MSAPSTPSAPAAVAHTNAATVSWTAPFDGGSPITGYTVLPIWHPPSGPNKPKDGGPGDDSPDFRVNVDGSTLSVRVSLPAQAGLEYFFQIRATNADGNSGYSSDGNTVTIEGTLPNPNPAATLTSVTTEEGRRAGTQQVRLEHGRTVGPIMSDLVYVDGNPYLREPTVTDWKADDLGDPDHILGAGTWPPDSPSEL
jgi:hypothetical protein